MSRTSHNRRHHHHSKRPQHHHPIFCSSLEVEMPKLMDDYLYHMHNAKANTKFNYNQPLPNKQPTMELNSNLEQILRSYLVQFWRYDISI
jgi:hypothetical protein